MKNVRFYLAALGLATALAATTPANVVFADEEVTEEVNNDDVQNNENTEGNTESNTETSTEGSTESNTEPSVEDIDTKTEAPVENTGDVVEDKKEFGEDEYIDADNWEKDKDIDPNAGEEIDPNTVVTEKEKKGLTDKPKPEEPKPEEPKPEEPKPEEPRHEEPVYVAPVVYTTTPVVVPIIPKTGDTPLEEIMFLGAAGLALFGAYSLATGKKSKTNSKVVNSKSLNAGKTLTR